MSAGDCRHASIASEIREATSNQRLHPLVRDSWASPRGICNCWTRTDDPESAMVFCQRDYGHLGPHTWRGSSKGRYTLVEWSKQWGPSESDP